MTQHPPHDQNLPPDLTPDRRPHRSRDRERPGGPASPLREPDGDVVPGDPPVPITVWHLPEPMAGTVVSAAFVRRLIANYTRHGARVVDLTTTALHRAPRRIDLIISAWPTDSTLTAEDYLAACSTRLAPGGCLALVLASTQTPDHLGTLVRAARAAGLTYLQHVVAAHHLTPATPPSRRVTRPEHHRRAPHLKVHSDLLIFRARGEQ